MDTVFSNKFFLGLHLMYSDTRNLLVRICSVLVLDVSHTSMASFCLYNLMPYLP